MYLYNVAESRQRNNKYANNYTPHFMLDGDVSPGSSAGSWGGMVESRMAVESPLTIDCSRTFDRASRTGTLRMRIENVSDEDVLEQRLFWILTENGLTFPNYGTRVFDHAMRDIMPDTVGELFEIPAHDVVNLEREFALDTVPVPDSCEFLVFVQNAVWQGPGYMIMQGARINVVPQVITSSGFSIADSLAPGLSATITAALDNAGPGNARHVRGVLRSSDPLVLVSDSVGTWDDLEPGIRGVNDADPFQVYVDTAAGDGRVVDLELVVTTFYNDTFTFAIQDTVHHYVPGAVSEPAPVPTRPSLAVRGPNPSAGSATVHYGLPRPAVVSLAVYDAAGTLVRTLDQGRRLAGGYAEVWDGRDLRGHRVPAGVYFCTLLLENDSTKLSEKLVIVE